MRMRSSTCLTVTGEKRENLDAGVADVELGELDGRRTERILSTLDMIVSKNASHCSLLFVFCVSGCGVRSLFTVLNICFELPGLLLMILE